jgi:hypothetical protein
MAIGTRRLARRGDKDELVLHRLLLGRGQRLRENDFGGGNVGSLLLRVCSLFEGVIVGSDLILILIPRTGRCLLGGRSEASIDVKNQTVNSKQDHKMYEFSKENLRRVDPEFWNDLLLCSRRRTATQRRGRNRAVTVVARSEMGVIKIF